MTGLSPAAVAELIRFLADFPLKRLRFAGRLGPPQALDVTVGTSPTLVSHGLGVVPRFVWVTLPDVDARVWQPVAPTADALTLQASAQCRVRVLLG